MKIKEIDYTHKYRRISVNNHHEVETFALGAGADLLLERCGEEDLAKENGVRINGDGMFVFTLASKK